jgi:hypothetical protein
MNALGEPMEDMGMPNHGQHVLVYCGQSAAYVTPVDEAARRTSTSRHRSPCGTVGVMV